MVTFPPRLALAFAYALVFSAGTAQAADVRPEVPAVPQGAPDDASGLRLGFTGSVPGDDPRMGLGAELSLGSGVSLRAEGAFLGDAGAGSVGFAAERGAVRGRLAYGGGLETFGMAPGVVTPWVEGERDWALDDGDPAAVATPRTRLSVGIDITAGHAAGLSLSAGAERGDGASDVSANAGMSLRF